MQLVVLDLNALISMQDQSLRPQWTPLLADPSHRLLVTDQNLLEGLSCGCAAVKSAEWSRR